MLSLRHHAAPDHGLWADHRLLPALPALMRVTFASYDDDPPLGGQGVLLHGMRAALERRGVDVATVSGRGDHAIHYPRVTRRAPLDLSLQLNRRPDLLTRNRPDVVHVYGGPGGVLLVRRLGVPLVYTAHHTYHQAHGRGDARRALAPLEARAYRRAAMVLPVSRSTADALHAMGVPSSHIEVMPPGIDVPGAEVPNHEPPRGGWPRWAPAAAISSGAGTRGTPSRIGSWSCTSSWAAVRPPRFDHAAWRSTLDDVPAFELKASFAPAGDQPKAVDQLDRGLRDGLREQTLLGVTGSGKTFTVANVIAAQQRPALVLSPNKTLAAQLWAEFREFFPANAVEYFVSYYDFYQPEAYIARTDTYIEKDSSRNDEIDRLRNSATRALLTRRDVIVVASVC